MKANMYIYTHKPIMPAIGWVTDWHKVNHIIIPWIISLYRELIRVDTHSIDSVVDIYHEPISIWYAFDWLTDWQSECTVNRQLINWHKVKVPWTHSVR